MLSPANPPATAPTPIKPGKPELMQLLGFMVGPKEYAIPVMDVQEINRVMPVSAWPQGPAWVKGPVHLRGKPAVVVDLRDRFGVTPGPTGADERTIFAEAPIAGERRVVGPIVDKASRVLRLDRACVQPVAADSPEGADGLINAEGKLGEDTLWLLSLERLFTAEQWDELNTALSAAA